MIFTKIVARARDVDPLCATCTTGVFFTWESALESNWVLIGKGGWLDTPSGERESPRSTYASLLLEHLDWFNYPPTWQEASEF